MKAAFLTKTGDPNKAFEIKDAEIPEISGSFQHQTIKNKFDCLKFEYIMNFENTQFTK